MIEVAAIVFFLLVILYAEHRYSKKLKVLDEAEAIIEARTVKKAAELANVPPDVLSKNIRRQAQVRVKTNNVTRSSSPNGVNKRKDNFTSDSCGCSDSSSDSSSSSSSNYD